MQRSAREAEMKRKTGRKGGKDANAVSIEVESKHSGGGNGTVAGSSLSLSRPYKDIEL